VTVTERISTENDWVLTPGTTQAIELTGTTLDIRRDRIMIIPCEGHCGVSDPTESVDMSLADYVSWVPTNNVVDRPLSSTPPSTPVSINTPDWHIVSSKYCEGMQLTRAQFDSDFAHLSCHNLCNPVDGTDQSSEVCKSGYFSGYDNADSLALCGSAEDLKQVCAVSQYCHSLDMHKLLHRAYVNTEVCDDPNHHVADVSYDIVYNTAASVPATEPSSRRLATTAWNAVNSWNELLNFGGVTFSSGGTFKVCACDSTVATSTSSEFCRTKDQFLIDAGKVHVSGVSCLIEHSRFQRGVCVEQASGGHRCYETAAPTLTVPTATADTVNYLPNEGPAATATAQSFTTSTSCLYGTEEQRNSSECAGANAV